MGFLLSKRFCGTNRSVQRYNEICQTVIFRDGRMVGTSRKNHLMNKMTLKLNIPKRDAEKSEEPTFYTLLFKA